MSAPDASDDILPGVIANLLILARPFVAAAVLQTAFGWHFGNYPAFPFWTFLAAVFVLGALRGPVNRTGESTTTDTLIRIVSRYVGLGIALGVAWLCAP